MRNVSIPDSQVGLAVDRSEISTELHRLHRAGANATLFEGSAGAFGTGTLKSVQVSGQTLAWKQPKFILVSGGQDNSPQMHNRLGTMGYTDRTVDLTKTTLASLAGYDVVICDDTAWGVAKASLMNQAYDAGYGVITSGNDTSTALAQHTGIVPSPGKGQARPPYRLEPEPSNVHRLLNGLITPEDRETDTGALPYQIRAGAVPLATMPWGAPNELTLNQASIETDLTGINSNGATNTRVAGGFTGGGGSWKLRTTWASGSVWGAWIANTPVTAGQPYTAVADVLQGTGSYNVRLNLEWVNASSVVFQTTTGTTTALTAAQKQLETSATAPTGAVNVRLTIYAQSTGAAGHYFDIDKIGLSNTATNPGWLLPGAMPNSWQGITSWLEEYETKPGGRWFHLHPYSTGGPTYATTSLWMQLLMRGAGWVTPSHRITRMDVSESSLTVGSSLVAWTATTPGISEVEIDCSLDQNSWTPCTNGAPIPLWQFEQGLDVGSLTVFFRQRLVAYDPTQAPSISRFFASVSTSEILLDADVGTVALTDSQVGVSV